MALMIFAFLLVAAAGVASAGPIYAVPVTYVALPSVPENIYNQVQDTRTGEYAFGYSGGPVAREEARTADGVTRGAYSYVDAHGIVQHYRYIADDDGFRVAGTNIPSDAASATPVLLAARKKRSLAVEEAVAAPVAIASVPTATSSQSRVQIHETPTVAKAIEVVPEVVPAADAVSVPVAGTPSESPIQKSAPLAVEAVEAVAAVPKTIAAEQPVAAVAASLPTATSSQSRLQIHKSLKTEIQEEPLALNAVPVAVETVGVAAIPEIAAATAVVAAPAPPLLAATATSNQRLVQIHKSANFELNALPQLAIGLQPINSASLPLLARSPVGVGLGVVPSPVAALAYYGQPALLAQP